MAMAHGWALNAVTRMPSHGKNRIRPAEEHKMLASTHLPDFRDHPHEAMRGEERMGQFGQFE